MKFAVLLASCALLLPCAVNAPIQPGAAACPTGTISPGDVSLAVGDSALIVSKIRCDGDSRMSWVSDGTAVAAIETRSDSTATVFGTSEGNTVIVAYPAVDTVYQGRIQVHVTAGGS